MNLYRNLTWVMNLSLSYSREFMYTTVELSESLAQMPYDFLYIDLLIIRHKGEFPTVRLNKYTWVIMH